MYDVINILFGKNYRGSCLELFFFQKDVQSLSNLLDNDLQLHLLDTLLVLDLKMLALQIWITIVTFYGIWT